MIQMYKNKSFKKSLFFCSIAFLLLYCISSCNKPNTKELYHKFTGNTWARFNLLSFEIPVEEADKSFDVYLFGRFTPDYQYNALIFNMIMNTPAGEERIHEYKMEVKSKAGSFVIECKNDSCEGRILLKKQLYLAKPGILKIEIENLTPRLVTEGIIGVGIRMVESQK